MIRITRDSSRPLPLSFISWSILFANLFLIFLMYYAALPANPIYPRIVSFVAIVAVFPYDLFQGYLNEFWFVHLLWILLVSLSAEGLFRYDRFARKAFIVLGVIHGVVLFYIMALRFGRPEFLGYFFKLYFNWVAVGSYIGVLTLPEIRPYFKVDVRSKIFKMITDRLHIKESAPKSEKGYYNLGLAYERLGRYDDAIVVLQKGREVNPDNEKTHFELGKIYAIQEKTAKAIHAFQETVRINPVYVQGFYRLGLAYEKEGCLPEAVDAFERASFIDQENPEVYKHLSRAYLSRQKVEEALQALQKAEQLSPQDQEVHYQRGLILMTIDEQIAKAKDAFRKAVQLKPDYKEAQFQLGLVCLKLNKHKEAIKAFKETIHLEDEHKQAHYQLGFAYAMIKDMESARREYRFLKERDPELAETLNMLIKSN